MNAEDENRRGERVRRREREKGKATELEETKAQGSQQVPIHEPFIHVPE